MDTNTPIIEKFGIKGLFGKKDVELQFRNKAQVYIGENGLGKTTILNALFFLLSCDFRNLLSISFSRIDIVLSGNKYSFSKDEIKAYLHSQDSRMRRTGFYQSLSQAIVDTDVIILQSIIRSEEADMAKMQKVLGYLETKGIKINAPGEYVMEIITQVVIDREGNKQIDKYKEEIEILKIRILYFPTYRRIEKDVRTMLHERRNRRRGSYTSRELDLESSFLEELSEAVHSGMSDIKKRRDLILRRISDISRRELDTMTLDLLKKQIVGIPDNNRLEAGDEEKIKAIIHKRQVGLSWEEQNILLQKISNGEIYNIDNRFLLYLLTRLKDIYNSYETYDLGIKSFVEICNSYLVDKQFVYNEAELSLDLEPTIKTGLIQEVLDLDLLSSGEKQLVALFATIYLEPLRRFIMLIDEPELSLSIYWQRKLLPDVVKSPNCGFLFAVTHSPFIFDNELQEFTTGMNEFVKP